MSRSELPTHWERDLPGLIDEQLRERLTMAKDFETRSEQRGMGRNPKAPRG